MRVDGVSRAEEQKRPVPIAANCRKTGRGAEASRGTTRLLTHSQHFFRPITVPCRYGLQGHDGRSPILLRSEEHTAAHKALSSPGLSLDVHFRCGRLHQRITYIIYHVFCFFARGFGDLRKIFVPMHPVSTLDKSWRNMLYYPQSGIAEIDETGERS